MGMLLHPTASRHVRRTLSNVLMSRRERLVSSSDFKNSYLVKNVEKETTFVKGVGLTPDIGLHLMTPDMSIWHKKAEMSRSTSIFQEDPYWAIYWPGGQALARYVLDNPYLVAGKRILDLGCGSGACAIAAAVAGAGGAGNSVTANDVDPVALAAAALNASNNGVEITLLEGDFLGHVDFLSANFDVMLVGDLCFDQDLARRVLSLGSEFVSRGGRVLLGDPGRWVLNSETKDENRLKCVAKYELPTEVVSQNSGLVNGMVYAVGESEIKI